MSPVSPETQEPTPSPTGPEAAPAEPAVETAPPARDPSRVEVLTPKTPTQEAVAKIVDQTSGLDILNLGNVLFKSRYFRDVTDAAQAVVKVIYGRELGLPPIASMQGIYVSKDGRLGLLAATMAGLVKRSKRYSYQIRSLTNEGCEIQFFENGEPLEPTSTFTLEDAEQARLTERGNTYRTYPRNMFFARAFSNGCRWHCPDLWNGAVYSAEELKESDTALAGPAEPEAPPVSVPDALAPLFERLGWNRASQLVFLGKYRNEGLDAQKARLEAELAKTAKPADVPVEKPASPPASAPTAPTEKAATPPADKPAGISITPSTGKLSARPPQPPLADHAWDGDGLCQRCGKRRGQVDPAAACEPAEESSDQLRLIGA